jgi:hypothetical protein
VWLRFLIEENGHLRANILVTDVILRHGRPQHFKHISQRYIGTRLSLQKRTNIAQNIMRTSSAGSLQQSVITKAVNLPPPVFTVVPVLSASISICPVRGSVADFWVETRISQIALSTSNSST